MAENLEQQAAVARQAADEAERERIAANARARKLAAEAAALEAQLEAQEREAVYQEHGDPQPAALNKDESSDEELAAAREAGVYR
jgi:hypothetical protein